MSKTTFAFLIAIVTLFAVAGSANASIIFDDFNVNEGRFALAPNFSGSSVGEDSTSTADRITTSSPFEGAGHQRLVLVHDTTTTPLRIRHLSGGGAAGGASGQPANTAFTTSAGVDGWIGLYAKTSAAGWNVQIWLEGPSNNGSAQKTLIADGAWHLYEWNIDDTSGGVDGWQASGIPGIIGGVTTVADGSHTIDSVLFRDGTAASSTIFWDFLAKSDSGTIAALVPEPASMGLLALSLSMIMRRRRA